MWEGFGWALAVIGLMIGSLVACVPGLPGAAVALLGVAGFAVATDFQILGPDAMLLACLLALAGGIAQVLTPVWGLRAVSSASGAASGAAVGSVLGLVSPLPVGALLFGTVGMVLGLFVGRARFLARVTALGGWVTAGVFAVAVDLVAVCGIAAVLATATFLAG